MTTHRTETSTTRSAQRHRRRYFAVTGLAAVLLGAACSPGVGTTGTSFAGQLTTRTLTVSANRPGTAYQATDANTVGDSAQEGFDLTYNSSSAVVAVDGTLGFDRGDGAGPALTLHLTAGALGMSGSATLVDPIAGVTVAANGLVSGFRADDHGNVAGSISVSDTKISFSTASAAAPAGTNPALEQLLAAEADFCADAQQRLAGLDDAEVPISSIANTHESPRKKFAASKSTLDPLTVRTWTDAHDVADDSGDLVTISKHISCKTRTADHLATTGVSTGADSACSVLNQRSFDLALAQLSPAQQAAATVPSFGADVVRQTGVEWTTPLAAATEFDGTTLRAHALLVRWTDPNYALFPDTIRGVHYCTVWSPAYAYATLLDALA
jgi:hypothetical protein